MVVKASQEAIEKSVEKMTLALSDQGLAFAEVKPSPKRVADGHTLAIAFHVEEGPHVMWSASISSATRRRRTS
jgi:outer membrane protein assembly factor BamA